ncbi:MAG: ABC transporter ATP-binding protein [Candidatus Saccharimonadaceae bacterium]|nr:ABC transporter ATP-binding protein [Candidatus Saccharimonadaceae bacterium]
MSAITVKNLTKKFRLVTAVDNLSFNIEEKHVVGFLGPNGSGKTSTIRMIVGLSKPTRGTIEISGSKIEFGRSTLATHKIGYLPELPSMYDWMTGQEYLMFIAKTFGLSRKTRSLRVRELVKLVDLESSIDRRIGTYSSGMKQRLGIAQALINDPKVLIMDEPVSALDPIGRKEILNLIKKLKKNRTILLSTHILTDVDRICDDVIIINHGELVTASPLAQLKAKYALPILEVDFDKNPRLMVKAIKACKWANKVTQYGNRLKIWVTDESVIDKNIPLKFFAKNNIGISRYAVCSPEAEDIFMRLLEKE